MRKALYMLPILVLLFLALAASNCDPQFRSDEPNPTAPPMPAPPPPAPSPIVVTAAGRVVALPTSIQMEDASRCTQDGNVVPCASIDWSVVNAGTGAFVASQTSGPGARVQVDGLAPGNYRVTQVATASDGRTDAEQYNVEVLGAAAGFSSTAEVRIRADGSLERGLRIERLP